MVGTPVIGWLGATTGHELDGRMARIRALAERAERVAAEQAEEKRKAAERAAAAKVAAERQQQSVEMPNVERPSVEQPSVEQPVMDEPNVEQPIVMWPDDWLDVPEQCRPLPGHCSGPVAHTWPPSLSEQWPQWDGHLLPAERLMNGEVRSVSPPVWDLGA